MNICVWCFTKRDTLELCGVEPAGKD